MQKAKFPNSMHNSEAGIYDTVLYNYFCTKIIRGAFCIACRPLILISVVHLHPLQHQYRRHWLFRKFACTNTEQNIPCLTKNVPNLGHCSFVKHGPKFVIFDTHNQHTLESGVLVHSLLL